MEGDNSEGKFDYDSIKEIKEAIKADWKVFKKENGLTRKLKDEEYPSLNEIHLAEGFIRFGTDCIAKKADAEGYDDCCYVVDIYFKTKKQLDAIRKNI